MTVQTLRLLGVASPKINFADNRNVTFSRDATPAALLKAVGLSSSLVLPVCSVTFDASNVVTDIEAVNGLSNEA